MSQSLQKFALILDILMKSSSPVSLTQFAATLKIPKSTVSRFLSTAESLGFVRRDKETGKYCLGLRLFELGCKAIEDIGLREAAIPEMEKLRDIIDENVLLTVMEGTHITYLDKIESRQAVVIQTNIGGTAPAYCVSSGKVMLAFDEDRLEQVIQQGLKQFTPSTTTDPDELRKECKKIRKMGYAINKGEYRLDVTGVASPIFDARQAVVGAISSATPASRMNQETWKRHIAAVVEAGQRISRLLGTASNKSNLTLTHSDH